MSRCSFTIDLTDRAPGPGPGPDGGPPAGGGDPDAGAAPDPDPGVGGVAAGADAGAGAGDGGAVPAGGAGAPTDGEWACPHEAHPEAERCVFHMDADGRAALDVDAADVVDRLVAAVEAGDPERKRLLGADLPRLELGYRTLSGPTRHPLDLRYADVDGLVLDHATVDPLVDLRGATVGDVVLDNAVLRTGLSLSGATVTGEFDAVESLVERDLSADGVVVEGPARFEETVVEDDTGFAGATFRDRATFAGGEFHGRSNDRGDNVDFSGVEFADDVSFRGTLFEFTTFEGAAFAGEADFQGAVFDGELFFDDAAAEGVADFDEARFHSDALFRQARFGDEAHFRGAEFEGGANTLQDDADFEGVTFEALADFEHAQFGHADFEGVAFGGEADFQEAAFDGDAVFDDATVEGLADFDEARFGGDALFRRVRFGDEAHFRGAEFEGGANTLQDDVDFEGATFGDLADFEHVQFGYADFREVQFAGEADFQAAAFEEDVDFVGTVFRGLADFDEARFEGDGDFGEVTFGGRADFRGVEFRGEARHLEESARFADAVFQAPAAFDDAVFTTANFEGCRVAESLVFRNVRFEDRVKFGASSVGDTAYVDLTDALLAAGSIVQPADHWVRYDCTRATVGDVSLSIADGAGGDGTAGGTDAGRFELLDYFRFVETDFDGFDFSAHRGYFDRNDWVLHGFDEGSLDYEVAVPATPEAVETTYLYAYNNAKAIGDGDAAIEFAIKRAHARRRKNLGYARDGSLDLNYRLRKLGDVVGNSLWYLSCGYGYRLWRILSVSLVVLLGWGLLYASPIPGTRTSVGSVTSVEQLFTADGLSILWQNLYYSFITFTTVGYGNIGPAGEGAQVTRVLAASEGVLGVLLAALVVFVLGRRVAT